MNNPALYNAAFTGFMAGAIFQVDITLLTQSEMALLKTEAELFAVALDAAIPTATVSSSQVTFLSKLVESVVAEKYSVGIAPNEYSATIASVAVFYSSVTFVSDPTVRPTVTVSASTALSIDQSDSIVFVDTAGGPVTVTLPPLTENCLFTFSDDAVNWQNQPCALHSSDSSVIQSPTNPKVYSSAGGTVTLTEGGASITYAGFVNLMQWVKL